ncbi:hypothetical protein TVAG_031850 [Trichomonas vaginalis G3]|uniref:Uncharacterized protein n=1 Tax=Trichomonas vaginalis (strain ATCC PRA-98 / G3) TaxID=412133 RepID=A2EUI4_TRIV3|nr:hypothetical protein TVAGG3_0363360 [Trichomonas vaginalis G3]EAY03686.1 hypothetical protein TVAG_031850 [Trichomonas vaginalis G3]KAI5532096.1 hypothetical protein TVAGG3_0363360 [Trichomonas vaginalis G3]|eukprot:XP_001315909.1 hypothetical protein [Trichomonas vaginalis G3]
MEELLQQDWDTFFQESDEKSYYHKKSVNLSAQDCNYYIVRCRFEEQITQGAINFTNNLNLTKVLIENTDFYNCSNSIGQGGSLYFGKEGQCAQNRICSVNSNSNLGAMYCYSFVSNIANYQNKLLDSAISHSGNLINDQFGINGFYHGNVEINYDNISYSVSKLYGFYSVTTVRYPSKASFSIITNNSDTISNSIVSYFYQVPYFLAEYCNHLSNNLCVQMGARDSTINITKCNFIRNTAKTEYFYFAPYEGRFYVDGSYIADTVPNSYYVIITNRNEIPFDNNIAYYYCKSSIETTIPIPIQNMATFSFLRKRVSLKSYISL